MLLKISMCTHSRATNSMELRPATFEYSNTNGQGERERERGPVQGALGAMNHLTLAVTHSSYFLDTNTKSDTLIQR